MSKKGKGKGKKGDEELEEEMRQLLKYDIETLENNIHYEKTRELNAINFKKCIIFPMGKIIHFF